MALTTRPRRGRAPLPAIIFLVVVGAALLALAAHQANGLRTRLETWPRVDAQVDSAAAIAWNRVYRDATYAKRVWVHYTYKGQVRTQRIDGTFTRSYGDQVRAAHAAVARGTIPVLIDPANDANVTIDAGYTAEFFALPLVVGGIGLLLFLAGVMNAIGALRKPAAGAPPSRRGRTVLAATVGVLFLCAGIALGRGAFVQRTAWTATSATVDSTDVVQHTTSSGNSTFKYAPRLWVAYSVRDTAYHAPLLTGAAWTSNQTTAQRAAETASSAEHRSITLYVNPADPYDVAMNPTSGGNLLLPLAFGLVGLVLVGLSTRVWKGQRRQEGIARVA